MILMDKINSRDHPFGVPSHGCMEPTKFDRGARSPRNPAEGYFPNKIDEYFFMKCRVFLYLGHLDTFRHMNIFRVLNGGVKAFCSSSLIHGSCPSSYSLIMHVSYLYTLRWQNSFPTGLVSSTYKFSGTRHGA